MIFKKLIGCSQSFLVNCKRDYTEIRFNVSWIKYLCCRWDPLMSPFGIEYPRDESQNFSLCKMAKCDVRAHVWRQLFFLTKSIDGAAVMCRLLWKIYFEFRSLLRALPFYFPRDITSFPRPRAGALANYLVRNSTLIHSHFANSISLAATSALSSYSTERRGKKESKSAMM